MLADAATVGIIFFLGLLAISGAILTLLRVWLVDGTMETGTALGVLGLLLFLSAAAAKSGSPMVMAVWIVLLVAAIAFLPALAERSEKSELFRMHEEDIDKYRRALKNNPQNYAAWREMAEIYMRMNRYDEAIAAFKEAIRLDPPDVQKMRRRLNLALEYKSGMPNAPTVICDNCGEETPKGKICIHCGEPLELTFLDYLLLHENWSAVARPVIVLLCGLSATMALLSKMPSDTKAATVTASVAIGGYVAWWMFRED